MAQQPLPGDPQQEDRDRQHHHPLGEGHHGTRQRHSCAEQQGINPKVNPIDQLADPYKQHAAAQRSDCINVPEITMAEIESGAQLATIHRDLKGLPEGRNEGNQIAKTEKPEIAFNETEILHRR